MAEAIHSTIYYTNYKTKIITQHKKFKSIELSYQFIFQFNLWIKKGCNELNLPKKQKCKNVNNYLLWPFSHKYVTGGCRAVDWPSSCRAASSAQTASKLIHLSLLINFFLHFFLFYTLVKLFQLAFIYHQLLLVNLLHLLWYICFQTLLIKHHTSIMHQQPTPINLPLLILKPVGPNSQL